MNNNTLIVRLKSVYSGEYLYAAADDLARDVQRRSVFTWRQTADRLGDWADWKMTGRVIDGKLRVRLTSQVYNDEQLFAPQEENYLYNSERRNVYTWRNLGVCWPSSLPEEETGEWFLFQTITRFGVSDRYALLNVKADEYLYAPANDLAKDSSRRRIFTWVGDKEDLVYDYDKHLWDIQIVSVLDNFFTFNSTSAANTVVPIKLNSTDVTIPVLPAEDSVQVNPVDVRLASVQEVSELTTEPSDVTKNIKSIENTKDTEVSIEATDLPTEIQPENVTPETKLEDVIDNEITPE